MLPSCHHFSLTSHCSFSFLSFSTGSDISLNLFLSLCLSVHKKTTISCVPSSALVLSGSGNSSSHSCLIYWMIYCTRRGRPCLENRKANSSRSNLISWCWQSMLWSLSKIDIGCIIVSSLEEALTPTTSFNYLLQLLCLHFTLWVTCHDVAHRSWNASLFFSTRNQQIYLGFALQPHFYLQWKARKKKRM